MKKICLSFYSQLRPPPTMIFANGENGNFIRSVAFCPDGQHIATIADDKYSILENIFLT
jgi:hypothetical protein